MKTKTMLAAALVGALTLATTSALAEDIDTRIGKLSFTHDFASGYPSKETIEKLFDQSDWQRACQTYLWARQCTERFRLLGKAFPLDQRRAGAGTRPHHDGLDVNKRLKGDYI